MERLEGFTVGLDGVVAQQVNYAESGFVLAHRNIRFDDEPDCIDPDDPSVTPIRADKFADVVQYDRSFFPATRDAFLRC